MKIAIALTLTALLATPAIAQQEQRSQNEAVSGAQSTVYMNNPDRIRSTLKAAPGIGGGGLTTSEGTCAGSFNLGGSTYGVGALAGKTYVMQDCLRMKEAYFLEQKGFTDAATARFCMDNRVKEAMWLGQTPCPQDRQKYAEASGKVATPSAPTGPVYTSSNRKERGIAAGTRYSMTNDQGRTRVALGGGRYQYAK